MDYTKLTTEGLQLQVNSLYDAMRLAAGKPVYADLKALCHCARELLYRRREAIAGIVPHLADFAVFPPSPNCKPGTCYVCAIDVPLLEGKVAIGHGEVGTFAIHLCEPCTATVRAAQIKARGGVA